tara:strand:- start:2037 stop:2297 length:261 start_codon:yes stop_codon:yes gene_type:complete
MQFFVYLIIAKNNDKRIVSYVGYTSNLKNRLKLHNTSKGAKFTRGRNWVLAYKKAYNSKSKAMKYEYRLKKNIKFRNELKKNFLEK